MAEYLVDLNASAAAIRAGYKEKTAAQEGYKLLRRDDVQKALTKAMGERTKRTEITQDYVIERLKEIADKEAADYQDSKLKYANKLRALELLGKHLGLFDQRSAGANKDVEDDPLTASLKELMEKDVEQKAD